MVGDDHDGPERTDRPRPRDRQRHREPRRRQRQHDSPQHPRPAVPEQPRETLIDALLGRVPLTSGQALSPGERTRAGLALLQARGVNLLILDEPTNHLDLPAIEQLESALDGYPGTFILVTHDRRMLEGLAVTSHLAVADGQVTEVG
jgi:ATPase subunit of ABC transporter with duplicated ATPase domains